MHLAQHVWFEIDPGMSGTALNPLDFIQYTPRTNCGECGQPTCLAFSVTVTKGGADPSKCPYLDSAGLQYGGSKSEESALERVDRGQEERDIALVAHLKTKILDVSFADIAPRLGAEYSVNQPDVLRFYYLAREIVLDKEGVQMDGNTLVDPRDQILLYNYISFGGGTPPTHEWIGMESLPNSISKVRTLSTYCERPLAKHFAGRPAELASACGKVGGKPASEESSASVSYVIPVLPHLPHYLLFWDEEPEDGFESRVKVLFDKNVLDFLDIESLVFSAERTAEYLMELDK